MAGPFDFTGQNIENTYQRILQTDGTNFYDGTGSAVSIGGSQNLQQVTQQGSITTIPITASIFSASNVSSNFSLFAHSASFNYMSASTGDFDANTIRLGGVPFTQVNLNNLKAGKPISTDISNLVVSQRDDDTFIRTSVANRMALYAGGVPSIDIKDTILTLGGLDGGPPQTPVQITSALTASIVSASSLTASIHGGTF